MSMRPVPSLEDLKGKDVVFIDEGIDQRTKEGWLLSNQLASFSEYEREQLSPD